MTGRETLAEIKNSCRQHPLPAHKQMLLETPLPIEKILYQHTARILQQQFTNAVPNS